MPADPIDNLLRTLAADRTGGWVNGCWISPEDCMAVQIAVGALRDRAEKAEARIDHLRQRLCDAEGVISAYFFWQHRGDRQPLDDKIRAYFTKYPTLPEEDAR